MSTALLTNRLLQALPPDVYAGLEPTLQLRPLQLEEELFQPGSSGDMVYFPLSGVVSLLTVTETGDSIEAMLLGREGMVGFWTVLGEPASPWLSMVQADGDALGMPVGTFVDLFDQQKDFRREVLAFCGALFRATSQSVACNRFHDLTPRAARWLLLMHDRTGADEFPLTHAFMSLMLGVHRPSVTIALRVLSQAGLTRGMGRGRLSIIDRRGLEDAACECYAQAPGLSASK